MKWNYIDDSLNLPVLQYKNNLSKRFSCFSRLQRDSTRDGNESHMSVKDSGVGSRDQERGHVKGLKQGYRRGPLSLLFLTVSHNDQGDGFFTFTYLLYIW